MSVLRKYGLGLALAGRTLVLELFGKRLKGTTPAPTDGQVLRYVAADDAWSPGDGATAPASRALTGVSGTSLASDGALSVPEVYTLTLHSAAASAGQRLTITRTGGGLLTRLVLVPAASESINDLAADAVAVAIDARTVEIVSDGTRWVCTSARGFDFSDIPGISRDWDPATGVEVGEAGTVTVLRDRIRGENLMGPATVSQRPVFRRMCHEANGAPAVYFLAANAQRLVANAVCEAERHTKMGSTIALFYVPMQTSGTGVVFDEVGSAFGATPGIRHVYSTAGSTTTVANNAGGSQTRTGPVTIFTTGVGVIARMIADSSTFDVETTSTDGTTVTSSVATGSWGAPDYYPPAYPLTIGAHANGGANHFSGYFVRALVWNRDLSDAERAQVRALMESKYRAVAPVATSAPIRAQISGAVKVGTLGDSKTEGDTGASVGQKGGWRKRVFDTITGITIDFVGTQTFGDFADNQHNGVSGLAIKTVSGAGAAYPGLQDVSLSPGSADKFTRTLNAASNTPHVWVVALGINNMNMADATRLLFDHPGDWLELAYYLYGRSNGASIVACTLTPCDTGTSARHQCALGFRLAMGSVVRELRRRGVPVAVADTFTAYPPNATYLFDGLHETTAGYNAAGDVISPAIKYAAGYA